MTLSRGGEKARARATMDQLLKKKEQEFFAHYDRRKMEVFFEHDSQEQRSEYLQAIETSKELSADRRYWNQISDFTGEVKKLYSGWLLRKFGEKRDYVKEEFLK